MSNREAYAIQDMRGGSRVPAAVGTFVVFAIVAIVLHIAFVEAFLGALALAAFVHGVTMVVPVAGDPTVRWQVRGRPAWLCWTVAAVLAVACFLALNEEDHGKMMPLILLGIPAVAIAAYGAKSSGMLDGGANRGK